MIESSGQVRLLPGADPDELIAAAVAEHAPAQRWCLFSGGNDSTVLSHRCRDHYDGLAWIDTGTAVPGVAKFVELFARDVVGKPLRILKAGDAYRTMVLGNRRWWSRYHACRSAREVISIEQMRERDERRYNQASGLVRSGPARGSDLGQFPHGFPGSGAHGAAYTRLKERQIEALVRRCKVGRPRSARVLLLSGIRRDESARRGRRSAHTRRGSAAYVAPLIDWTNPQMRLYRQREQLPESPAAALLHRSGECNCGAFAGAGDERAMLMSLYPDWWETTIAPLEREAERLGIRWCRWGGFDLDGVEARNAAGEANHDDHALLCSSCESRQLALIDRTCAAAL